MSGNKAELYIFSVLGLKLGYLIIIIEEIKYNLILLSLSLNFVFLVDL